VGHGPLPAGGGGVRPPPPFCMSRAGWGGLWEVKHWCPGAQEGAGAFRDPCQPLAVAP
jgi:hypothetical protein